MASRYVIRSLEPVLRRATREFPVVMVTGPRQSGKTTLLRRFVGPRGHYLSLDLPDVRAAVHADPRGALDAAGAPVVIDEVQHAPGLLPFIRERVDAQRSRVGQYLLSGSQNILLAETIAETLAGRVAVLRLLPLSRREETGEPGRPLPWERRRPTDRAAAAEGALTGAPLWRVLLRGGYPELVTHPRRDLRLWHASYVATYLERDVRSLRQVGDLTQFQAFLRVLAARSAALLNLSDLARDLGLAVNTVKAWLSVLEATHQIAIVRPYFANIGKRLVKTPKVYFLDTGLLCHLVGLSDVPHARAGPMAGAIFETAVLAEITKAYAHRGETVPIHFFRTSGGVEIDFLVDLGDRLVPIEVKATATPLPSHAESLRLVGDALGPRMASGWVVHGGAGHVFLGGGTRAIPFASL